MDYRLLHQLCQIHAPSGNEVQMKEFLLNYIAENQSNWKVKPEVLHGEGFQDCLLLVFGKPRTVIFAHMDSIGFTVRYNNGLVKIGGPKLEPGTVLVGEDSQGPVEGTLAVDHETNAISINADRTIDRGTELVFKCDFRETEESVQSCYLDNRLGVWSALQVAETLENGIIAFSCWEEHGGGSVAYLAKYIHEKYGITQALISDITWVTDGVPAGQGAAISLRDSLIPRRSYVNRLMKIAYEANEPYQLEVEGAGGSDGKELQFGAAPWDWCFVGAPEDKVHSPDEIVHKADIKSMVRLYMLFMREL